MGLVFKAAVSSADDITGSARPLLETPLVSYKAELLKIAAETARGGGTAWESRGPGVTGVVPGRAERLQSWGFSRDP